LQERAQTLFVKTNNFSLSDAHRKSQLHITHNRRANYQIVHLQIARGANPVGRACDYVWLVVLFDCFFVNTHQLRSMYSRMSRMQFIESL
jgi:hypothetical protein